MFGILWCAQSATTIGSAKSMRNTNENYSPSGAPSRACGLDKSFQTDFSQQGVHLASIETLSTKYFNLNHRLMD